MAGGEGYGAQGELISGRLLISFAKFSAGYKKSS
jgi:hypothetical protein